MIKNGKQRPLEKIKTKRVLSIIIILCILFFQYGTSVNLIAGTASRDTILKTAAKADAVPPDAEGASRAEGVTKPDQGSVGPAEETINSDNGETNPAAEGIKPDAQVDNPAAEPVKPVPGTEAITKPDTGAAKSAEEAAKLAEEAAKPDTAVDNPAAEAVKADSAAEVTKPDTGESEQDAKQAEQPPAADPTPSMQPKEPVVNQRAAGAGAEIAVSDVVSPEDQKKIAVIKVSKRSYTIHSADAPGLRAALFDIYSKGEGVNDDYILYLGADITIPWGDAITSRGKPENITNGNITFFALGGKIGTLIITGTYLEDLTDLSTTPPPGASTLHIGWKAWHFGTDVELRNFKYDAQSLYANAHRLALKAGSWYMNSLNLYGGTDGADVTGNAQLEVYSTGKMGITIIGGSDSGTLDGNITTTVYNTSGEITAFYGAGLGLNGKKVTVNGNVTSDIRNMNPSSGLGPYQGGGNYADVTGTISNSISGEGSNLWDWIVFVGGSVHGDIGTKGNKADAIINILDFSKFSGGNSRIVVGGNGLAAQRSALAANQVTGIIYGNITNRVTAGEYNSGGKVSGIDGGGDPGTCIRTGNGNGIDSREEAEQEAQFRVYGNIQTELVKGCFSTGGSYARAAGYGGYIEGDTTIEVGTGGLAYGGTYPGNLQLSTDVKGRGANSNWDISGGGGDESSKGGIYIYGDTKIVNHSSVARHTFGGSFGGTIEGDTTNENRGGIVHTLEGGGFKGYKIIGSCHAISYGGQVDFFAAGGGQNDDLIQGNTKVTVKGGVMNGHVGGSYSSPRITGDAEVNILGGIWSGTPIYESYKKISGGPTSTGTIEGNIRVNLDYTQNSTDIFKLPQGQNIALYGGIPIGAGTGSRVGTKDSITSIEVNVKTGNPDRNVLEGTAIYGDGSSNLQIDDPACGAEQITINIDAPGSAIGAVGATNSEHGLTKDVDINISTVKSVESINGGGKTEGFQDSMVSSSSVNTEIYIGSESGNYFNLEVKNDVQNFTKFTIENAYLNTGGSVVNSGRLANVNDIQSRLSNHANNGKNFGDIILKNKAGIEISGSKQVNCVTGKTLAINGDGNTITTPPGQGRVIVTNYDAAAGNYLTWKNPGGDGMHNHTGTWFGNNNFYRVLTFSPDKNESIGVTPYNFRGNFLSDPNENYAGDNADGYGLALKDPPVCKIVKNGVTTTYKTLEEAVTKANDFQEITVIEMLIDEYITSSNMRNFIKKVKITTADKNATSFPYRGSNSKARIIQGAGVNEPLFTIIQGGNESGTLSLENIILSGGSTSASQPLIHNTAGRVELGTGSVIENYQGSGPVILQSKQGQQEPTLVLSGGTIQNNNVTARGTIDNQDGCKIEIKSGTITGNTAASAGGIYQAGTMSVAGKVIITGNKAGNVANNVYLPQTTTGMPYANYIKISSNLEAGSKIGVMTEKSPDAGNQGIPYTIIAVPDQEVGNMESFFQHDQLLRNPAAYKIIHDSRSGEGKNLILQGTETKTPFAFFKIEHQTSENALKTPLEGAKFTLYTCAKQIDSNHTHDLLALPEEANCWDVKQTEVSDQNGLVDFGKLLDGEYMLAETEAPADFERPLGQWYIVVGKGKITIEIRKGIDGSVPPNFIIEGSGNDSVYYLPNRRPYVVPISGNPADYGFLTSGKVLVVTALAGISILFIRRIRSPRVY